MIWSAALPGAALRAMRTAAGRRALHVALLVGGLFVLGVLCGERAQAADEAPSLKDTVGQVLDLPAERPREVRGATGTRGSGPGHDAEKGLRALTGNVVRSVEDRVAEVPPLEALPTLPSAASLPVLPSSLPLSVLPDLSDPIDSGLPGRSKPADPDPRPAPTSTGTGTGPSTSTGTAPDAPHDTADASDATGPRDSDGAGDAAQDAYGPVSGGHGGASVTRHVDIHRAVPAPTEHVPAHRAPGGDPDGTLGTTSGADQGTPRQGDAHAVTPQHGIAFRLVPGALVRADTVEPWDRYRDIPVSPA